MDNLLVYLPLVIGVASVAIATYSKRFQTLPGIKAIKDKYPILNVALATASQMTNGTPYDFLLDAAAQLWIGEGLTAEEAAKYTLATVEYFDRRKYLATDERYLDASAVARGQEIANLVVAHKNG